MKNKVTIFWGSFALAVLYSNPAAAGQMYVYKDRQGTTLLTNKKSSDPALTKVKVTYYADSNIHSYRNWGATEAAVLPSYHKNKNAFDPIIQQAALQYGIAEGLIKAVMHTESGFNIHARSPVGAQGLMQLMPATARRFNVNNAFDPNQNIFAGAKYLSWLLKRFNGDMSLALAAYNAGEGNVDKYKGIPPFRETQDYVRRVMSRYQNLYAQGLLTGLSAEAAQKVAQSNPSTFAKREIIALAEGYYTDTAGTYVTEHASASAHLQISN